MSLISGLAAAADHQHQNRGAREEYDPKMKVMDPAHQERTVGRVDAAAGSEPELGNHATQAHDQASHQAPERPLQVKVGGVTTAPAGGLSVCRSPHRFIDPLHKHSQEEDGSDGRGQVAGHGLDVIKQLTALGCLDDGDPADADGHDAQDPDSGEGRTRQPGRGNRSQVCGGGGHRTSPAHNQELSLAGLRPDASPDVHGEQGAAAVEDGGQRGHEGSQHHRQHQTPQPCTVSRDQGGRRGAAVPGNTRAHPYRSA